MSDTVSRFDGRADDYARYRPTYPPQAIDEIIRGLGAPSSLWAIDVGAGTGISTALLRARGVKTIGIEPNAEMRAVALANGLEVHDGKADELPFQDASADLITAFQAFHWFAQPDVAAEFARILRPRGRLAVVWNERDDADPFTRGYGEAVDGFAKRVVFAEQHGAVPTASGLIATLFPAPRWRLREASFFHEQRFDRAGLAGRARSTSYAPREGPAFERMSAELDRLHARYADASGRVTLRMVAEVYLCDREEGDGASTSELRA